MKYLNSYRLFESGFTSNIAGTGTVDDDTIKTIEEICYDITDEGFNIILNRGVISRDLSPNGREISYIQIDKRIGSNEFKYSEVKDVVDRIVNYLDSRFVNYFIVSNGWHSIKNLKNFDRVTNAIIITFDEDKLSIDKGFASHRRL